MQGLPKTITINKKVGETPLQALDSLRERDLRFRGVKLAYAGRLDPMAGGKLLVVVGDECKNHHAYLGLDKEYEVEVAFGVSSDSGDVLGIISSCDAPLVERKKLSRAVANLAGKISVPFPIYSSKPVRGKPLFQWALEGKLGEIEVPLQNSCVYRARLESLHVLSREELQERVHASIDSLPEVTEESKAAGRDFRRDDVRASWEKLFAGMTDPYAVARIVIVCSSGTYMRTLAESLAKELGTCGLALSITRTRMGKYLPLWRGVGMWLKQY